jgi:hypothetical protein
MLEQDSVPAFGTLTIPAKLCPDPERLSQALAMLRKRFARRYPEAAIVVKREHHRSGIPHFHTLIWLGDGRTLAQWIAELRPWLRQNWAESLGVERARVGLDHPRDSKAVSHYVSSYLWRGKGYQLDARGVNWGRWWHIWAGPGHERLPWSERTETDAPAGRSSVQDPGEKFYWRMARAMRRAGYISRPLRRGSRSVRFIAPKPAEVARLAELYRVLGEAEQREALQERPNPERALRAGHTSHT